MKNKRYKIISPIIIITLAILLLFNINIKENFKINNATNNFVDFYSRDVKIISIDNENVNGKPVRLDTNKDYILEISDSKANNYSVELNLDDTFNHKSFYINLDNSGEFFPVRDLSHLMSLNTYSIIAIILIAFSTINLFSQLINISAKKRYRDNSVTSDNYLNHTKIYHIFIILNFLFFGIVYLLIEKANLYKFFDIVYLVVLCIVPLIIYLVLYNTIKVRRYYSFKFVDEYLIVKKNTKVIFVEKFEDFKFYTSIDKIKSVGSGINEKYYIELIPYDAKKPILLIKLYDFDKESFKALKSKLKPKSYYDSMFNNGKYYDQKSITLLAKPRNKILSNTFSTFIIISIIAGILLYLLYKFAKTFFIIALFSYMAIVLILLIISIIFAIRNKYIETEFVIDHNIYIGDLTVAEENIKEIKMTNPINIGNKETIHLKISSTEGKFYYSIKPLPADENEEFTNEDCILLYDLLMYEYGNFATII